MLFVPPCPPVALVVAVESVPPVPGMPLVEVVPPVPGTLFVKGRSPQAANDRAANSPAANMALLVEWSSFKHGRIGMKDMVEMVPGVGEIVPGIGTVWACRWV